MMNIYLFHVEFYFSSVFFYPSITTHSHYYYKTKTLWGISASLRAPPPPLSTEEHTGSACCTAIPTPGKPCVMDTGWEERARTAAFASSSIPAARTAISNLTSLINFLFEVKTLDKLATEPLGKEAGTCLFRENSETKT